MQWVSYCLWVLVWSTAVRSSRQCLSRYITRPINGYHCQQSEHTSVDNIGFQQCVRACITDETCWTLSYNHSGQLCVLGDEPCVTADRTNDLSMMILRSTTSSPCREWTPFNKTYGSQHGYPKRAIQAKIKYNRVAVVVRPVTSNGLRNGRSTSYKYQAYMLDSQQNMHTFNDGYEILLVGKQCSTAWVPYTAGEPIPVGPVVAGRDDLAGKHYVVAPRDTFMYFTVYVAGSNQAMYPLGPVLHSFTNMYLLIALA